jgi:hypothetical protein
MYDKKLSRRKFIKNLALILSSLSFSNCTTIGLENPRLRDSIDYGPFQEIKFGVYKTDDVKEKRVEEIMGAINEEYSQYNLGAKLEWTKSFERKGFNGEEILESIVENGANIKSPCDRNIYLIGRNFADNIWGLTGMPEILGATELVTCTQMLLVANYGTSLNQAIGGPLHFAKHEALHLLGCEDSFFKDECYERIKNLKDAKEVCNRFFKEDFFPGYNLGREEVLFTRKDVNKNLEDYKNWIISNRLKNENSQLSKSQNH